MPDHYTDGAGLFGVIGSGTIRPIIDVYGLNDPSEIRETASEIACGLLGTTPKAVIEPLDCRKDFRDTTEEHGENMAPVLAACSQSER